MTARIPEPASMIFAAAPPAVVRRAVAIAKIAAAPTVPRGFRVTFGIAMPSASAPLVVAVEATAAFVALCARESPCIVALPAAPIIAIVAATASTVVVVEFPIPAALRPVPPVILVPAISTAVGDAAFVAAAIAARFETAKFVALALPIVLAPIATAVSAEPVTVVRTVVFPIAAALSLVVAAQVRPPASFVVAHEASVLVALRIVMASVIGSAISAAPLAAAARAAAAKSSFVIAIAIVLSSHADLLVSRDLRTQQVPFPPDEAASRHEGARTSATHRGREFDGLTESGVRGRCGQPTGSGELREGNREPVATRERNLYRACG